VGQQIKTCKLNTYRFFLFLGAGTGEGEIHSIWQIPAEKILSISNFDHNSNSGEEIKMRRRCLLYDHVLCF
jgi:hypothetical protein